MTRFWCAPDGQAEFCCPRAVSTAEAVLGVALLPISLESECQTVAKLLCKFWGQGCAGSGVLPPVAIFALSFSTQRLSQTCFRSSQGCREPQEGMPAAWVRQVRRFLTLCRQHRPCKGGSGLPAFRPVSGEWQQTGTQSQAPAAGNRVGNVLPEAEVLRVVRGEAARAPPGRCRSVWTYPRMIDLVPKERGPCQREELLRLC